MNIEEQIQEAQKKGLFDELPGAGQPLSIKQHSLTDDRQLAFDLLQQAGFRPNWIQTRIDLEADITRTFSALKRAWQQADTAYRSDKTWLRAEKKFRQECLRLNQNIRHHNLTVPAGMPHLFEIDIERELVKLRRVVEPV